MNPENPGDNPENLGDIPGQPGDSELDSELQAGLDGPTERVLDQNASDELAGEPAERFAGLPHGKGGASIAAMVAAKQANGIRDIDWEALRRRYVEGIKGDDGAYDYPSLDSVAAHFGLRGNRVRERAAKEGWRGQRTQWQAQVEATRRQAKAAAMAREATNLDGRALDAAKMGLQLVVARLAEIGQAAQRARSENGVGGGSGATIDAQEQQRLAQAADLWHKVGLRAVGDPETHRLEITGAGGAPIEIAAELRRDDPDRLAGVLGVLAQAGLGDLFGGQGVVEGEVVDDA